MTSLRSEARHADSLSLETLAYKYGTDKSKDDHKYVDIYHSLLADRRHHIRNVTEIGVASGQSIAMWHEYFARAHIWGFDPMLRRNSPVLKYFAGEPRVHLYAADAYQPHAPGNHSLVPESMDLIIDDAWHYPNPAQKLLEIWWPLVRPGGYYIIEDLSWDNNQDQRLSLLESPLTAGTRDIIENNAAFYIDSLFGHRNFSDFKNTTDDSSEVYGTRRPAQCCTRSRRLHNSHVVVIQKRDASRPLRPYAPNLANPTRRPMTYDWMQTTSTHDNRNEIRKGD